MTITIEGSLEGPPPFDSDAFKAKLARRLDMHSVQFNVRRVKSRRRVHEVQTSPSVFITVDVDGKLRAAPNAWLYACARCCY